MKIIALNNSKFDSERRMEVPNVSGDFKQITGLEENGNYSLTLFI